jgi:diacylglycerol kinase (ATP)
MHVTLFHMPDAGDGEYTRDDLLSLLENAGHAATYHSLDEDWTRALVELGDLVLIAGGDGTVGTVALRLIETGVPFAILPLGTANNVARYLGWTGSVSDIIGQLEQARRRPFDVGVARGPWGATRFIEGVGLGVFARTMAFTKANKKAILAPPADADEEIARDLHLVHAFATESAPAYWTVDLDGERIAEPLLLLQILNTGLVGPNLELAPDADVSDGLLDLVLLRESERDTLIEYLDGRLEGKHLPLLLPVRRARHVRLTAESARVHIDDQVWPDADEPPPPAEAPFEIDIRVEAGALTALTPA